MTPAASHTLAWRAFLDVVDLGTMEAAYALAADLLDARTLAWLTERHEIDVADLGCEITHLPPCGVARVEAVGGVAVMAERDGARAVLIPFQSHEGFEVAAWHPREGWTRGLWADMPFLGDYAWRDGPLVIHATPIEWLKAGREGVVVVSEKLAKPLLRGCDRIVVPDVAYGERLERMLRVKGPSIEVAVGGSDGTA